MDISNYEDRLEELNEQEEFTNDEQKEMSLLEDVERLHKNQRYDRESLQAWLDLGNEYFEGFDEAYQGKYRSDEDFVEQLCEDCGDIPDDLPNYIYIDWEKTARDIMMDYSEENGYYFRNL